jgi:hypothetical protein
MNKLHATDIVKKVMENKGVNVAALTKMLELNSYRTTQTRLRKPNMRTDTFQQMLNALGYEVIVQPMGNRKPQGAYILTSPRTETK